MLKRLGKVKLDVDETDVKDWGEGIIKLKRDSVLTLLHKCLSIQALLF